MPVNFVEATDKDDLQICITKPSSSDCVEYQLFGPLARVRAELEILMKTFPKKKYSSLAELHNADNGWASGYFIRNIMETIDV